MDPLALLSEGEESDGENLPGDARQEVEEDSKRQADGLDENGGSEKRPRVGLSQDDFRALLAGESRPMPEEPTATLEAAADCSSSQHCTEPAIGYDDLKRC